MTRLSTSQLLIASAALLSSSSVDGFSPSIGLQRSQLTACPVSNTELAAKKKKGKKKKKKGGNTAVMEKPKEPVAEVPVVGDGDLLDPAVKMMEDEKFHRKLLEAQLLYSAEEDSAAAAAKAEAEAAAAAAKAEADAKAAAEAKKAEEAAAAAAKAEAEAAAKAEAEAKAAAEAAAKAEAEAAAKAEADAKAAAEAKAKAEAEAKAKAEADAKAAAEAAKQAAIEAEEKRIRELDQRMQPLQPNDEERLASKYAGISDVGERAFTILQDLRFFDRGE